MASIGNIFQGARALGDASSINSFGHFQSRVRSRVLGKGLGRTMGSLNVFGLIAWAQFLNFLTNSLRAEMAEPVWFGSFASYAAGWEYGFTQGPAANIPSAPRPYFHPAIRKVQAEMFGGQRAKTPTNMPRSGLYSGGQHVADISALIKGDIGGRVARRAAGRETSRFFWGALMNPDKNIMESFAKAVVREARRNIRTVGLVKTGALKNSITWADSIGELKAKSYKAIRAAAEGDPRIDRRFGEL